MSAGGSRAAAAGVRRGGKMVRTGRSGSTSPACLPPTGPQSSSPQPARPRGLGTGGAHGPWFSSGFGEELVLSQLVPKAALAGSGVVGKVPKAGIEPQTLRAPLAAPHIPSHGR